MPNIYIETSELKTNGYTFFKSDNDTESDYMSYFRITSKLNGKEIITGNNFFAYLRKGIQPETNRSCTTTIVVDEIDTKSLKDKDFDNLAKLLKDFYDNDFTSFKNEFNQLNNVSNNDFTQLKEYINKLRAKIIDLDLPLCKITLESKKDSNKETKSEKTTSSKTAIFIIPFIIIIAVCLLIINLNKNNLENQNNEIVIKTEKDNNIVQSLNNEIKKETSIKWGEYTLDDLKKTLTQNEIYILDSDKEYIKMTLERNKLQYLFIKNKEEYKNALDTIFNLSAITNVQPEYIINCKKFLKNMYNYIKPLIASNLNSIKNTNAKNDYKVLERLEISYNQFFEEKYKSMINDNIVYDESPFFKESDGIIAEFIYEFFYTPEAFCRMIFPEKKYDYWQKDKSFTLLVDEFRNKNSSFNKNIDYTEKMIEFAAKDYNVTNSWLSDSKKLIENINIFKNALLKESNLLETKNECNNFKKSSFRTAK